MHASAAIDLASARNQAEAPVRALACSGPEQHGHSVLSMPIAHLAGFRGVLQVDGYGGYKVMAERGEVRLAFCWSHVRRRLYELASAGPAPIASEALIRIADLYRIEREIRGRSAAERRTIRQERSRSLVQAFELWLREKLALVSQKSTLAEAIRYALSRWTGLSLFLDDGRIEINSNVPRSRPEYPPSTARCAWGFERGKQSAANRRDVPACPCASTSMSVHGCILDIRWTRCRSIV